MLFNSPEFFLFFPAVTAVYFALPHRFRWILLLAASYFFYMAWKPGYALLLLTSTLVDYGAAIRMAGAPDQRRRRHWLYLSLGCNLGLLFYFKYYNFFADSLEPLVQGLGLHIDLPRSEWLLPLGISFYTFQTLGYAIDVYRGHCPPERHLGRFALYVAFFPQLVAGPIERARQLLPQFQIQHHFNYARVTAGLKLMCWGLFKKVVIADRLALLVDHVFANPQQAPGPALALGILFFAFQIYCDFSGYTDMARGAAAVLGIRLMENFKRPYFATSVTEFWRRWHISLSTWFRDYVYIPLGGNRVSTGHWMANILFVFVISGLWHGAACTFLVWGLLHGLALLLENTHQNRYKKVIKTSYWRILRLIMTFSLVCLAWTFFRAQSISDALYILSHLHLGWSHIFTSSFYLDTVLGQMPRDFVLSILLILFLVAVEAIDAKRPLGPWLASCPGPVRWLLYSLGLWAIFLLGRMQENEFIYFVF